MATFRVIGPLALIKDERGMQHYRYRDVNVTDDEFPLAELRRLEELGLLAKADESADEGDDADLDDGQGDDQGDDEDDEPAPAPRRHRRPAGSGD